MKLIYIDITRWWTQCRQEAIFVGILFMLVGRLLNRILNINRSKHLPVLYFANSVFLYYLLYVTLLSRTIGSRREVGFLPFTAPELMNEDFHYVVENVLLFIPFGILLYMTLQAYGRKCHIGTVFLSSFLTSASVEILQYVFSCEKSEIDDVITNVFGAVIGYMGIKKTQIHK